MKTKLHTHASLVAKRIKRARIKAGLSQQELGELVFKTGAAIGYIERGYRGVNVEDLVRFSKVLNVPIDYFFSQKITSDLVLQETLDKLQQHIAKLNTTLLTENQIIEELIRDLPRAEELRLITEASINPILLISQTGKILYVTRSIKDMIGFRAKDLLGKSHLLIVPKERKQQCKQNLNKLFTKQKRLQYESQLQHLNTALIDVEINAGVIKKDGKLMVHAILRNITDRKKIQHQLAAMKKQCVSIFDNIPTMILALDEKMNIVIWNKECEEITAYSKEEIIANGNAFHLIFADLILEKKSTKEFIKTIKNQSKVDNRKLRVHCKNGTVKEMTVSIVADQDFTIDHKNCLVFALKES
ncbi:MAG: PAS domain S-box protein [Candidatus Woesebacteria bacterium]|jgi:PAS domain S-box-containing protein